MRGAAGRLTGQRDLPILLSFKRVRLLAQQRAQLRCMLAAHGDTEAHASAHNGELSLQAGQRI